MSAPIVIIGAGPAGLSAAWTLQQQGIKEVIVLEREADAGGLPRHCGHLGFGMFDFYRLWRGPEYARQLRERLSPGTIRCGTTVLALKPGGELSIRDAEGVQTLQASQVLMTTGTRETPRSARLIGGTRPFGVMNTGSLQRYAYETGQRPFRHPVVVGSEWVAFSSLLTLRHMGVRPLALVEAGDEILAPGPAALISDTVFGVPVETQTRLLSIHGQSKVEGVTLLQHGEEVFLPCDGVVLSGQFVPEASLIRQSHLQLDAGTGGPAIDSYWRCSDPAYFAAGNVLRPVEHSGVAAAEGVAAARAMLQARDGQLPAADAAVSVTVRAPLTYLYPQRLYAQKPPHHKLLLRARVPQRTDGTLRWLADGVTIGRQRLSARPCRRVQLRWPAGDWQGARQLELRMEP